MNIDVKNALIEAGLSALPANRERKRPTLHGWKPFSGRLPGIAEHDTEFAQADAVCIVCGAVSRNVELIDFDHQAALYDEWSAKVDPQLLARLVIEQSQSGGRHVAYRCQEAVQGNMKLAQRRDATGKVSTFIETRGEGGLFLCHPTPGYELIQGSLTDLPTITKAERLTLLEAAWSLNEIAAEPMAPIGAKSEPAPAPVASSGSDAVGLSPGDDYNARGEVLELLLQHGWKVESTDAVNHNLVRPGKEKGQSATLRHSDRTFHVFSTNAHPFEHDGSYGPFQTFTLLKCDGDFSRAAGDLRRLGYGAEHQQATGVDLSGLMPVKPAGKSAYTPADPGQFPESLLHVPGFIDQVIEFNLSGCHRRQPVLALGGALCLLSVLTGRNVEDETATRTNIYAIGIGESGEGKDRSLAVNREILAQSGATALLGPGGAASHVGILTALESHPALLFQFDEMGRILKTLGNPSNAPHLYHIPTVLMKLFTSSNGIYMGDAYADAKRNRTIDQPHAVLYGTTVPDSFYESMTAESVSDGFLSRMLIFEGAENVPRHKPGRNPNKVPAELVEVARLWFTSRPGGNLANEHPAPHVVLTTTDAEAVFDALDSHSESTRKAIPKCIPGRTLWTRALEKARKLALLFACSRSFNAPAIDQVAARWACEVTRYLTERMLFLCVDRIASSPTDGNQQKLKRVISQAERNGITKTDLYKATKSMRKRDRDDAIAYLDETDQITTTTADTDGRPIKRYYMRDFAPSSI